MLIPRISIFDYFLILKKATKKSSTKKKTTLAGSLLRELCPTILETIELVAAFGD